MELILIQGFYFPPSIPPASILLVRSNNPFGRAVRLVTKGRWNHAALCTTSPTGKPEDMGTIEAHDLHGVRALTLQHYVDDPQVEALGTFHIASQILPLLPGEAAQVIAAAQAMQGKPYDLSQILWIYLSLWLPMPKNAKRWDSPNELICSELVVRAYRAIGIDLCPPGVPIGQVTPAHLEQMTIKSWESTRVLRTVVEPKGNEGSDR